jgi:mono/diheme cytochrome c family protein
VHFPPIALVVVACLVGTGSAGAVDGPAVFKARCAQCHGEEGKPDTPISKGLKVSPLAGNAKVAGAGEAELVKAIKANPKHASVTAKVSDEELAAAAAHARTLAATKP